MSDGVYWGGWSNGTDRWERCPVHGVWTKVSAPAIPCHRCEPEPPAPVWSTSRTEGKANE